MKKNNQQKLKNNQQKLKYNQQKLKYNQQKLKNNQQKLKNNQQKLKILNNIPNNDVAKIKFGFLIYNKCEFVYL